MRAQWVARDERIVAAGNFDRRLNDLPAARLNVRHTRVDVGDAEVIGPGLHRHFGHLRHHCAEHTLPHDGSIGTAGVAQELIRAHRAHIHFAILHPAEALAVKVLRALDVARRQLVPRAMADARAELAS